MAEGKMLKEHRLSKGLTMQEVADKIGIAKQQIYLWEQSDKLSDKALKRLAKALDFKFKRDLVLW